MSSAASICLARAPRVWLLRRSQGLYARASRDETKTRILTDSKLCLTGARAIFSIGWSFFLCVIQGVFGLRPSKHTVDTTRIINIKIESSELPEAVRATVAIYQLSNQSSVPLRK